MVRHFTRLSHLELRQSTSASIPLGSCTMKYNPKLNERVARLPGLRRRAPAASPTRRAAGAARAHAPSSSARSREISGHGRASRSSPPRARRASSPGIMHDPRLPRARAATRSARTCSIPDSAHGTNPASAALNGYEVVADARRAPTASSHPRRARRARWTTHGRRADAHQPEHARALRDAHRRDLPRSSTRAGGLVYVDGANLNALLGDRAARRHRLRRHALQPAQDLLDAARRRRPGRRARCGAQGRLAPYLPAPVVARATGGALRARRRPARTRSAACTRSTATSACWCARYAYIRTLGADGPAPHGRDGAS